MTSKTKSTDEAVQSIIKQWQRGERRLAGERASELVFGKARKPNEAVLDEVADKIPGIREYIAAPAGALAEQEADDGGNPGDSDRAPRRAVAKPRTVKAAK